MNFKLDWMNTARYFKCLELKTQGMTNNYKIAKLVDQFLSTLTEAEAIKYDCRTIYGKYRFYDEKDSIYGCPFELGMMCLVQEYERPMDLLADIKKLGGIA